MADTGGDAAFQLVEPRRQVLFDLEAFDRAIRAHGARVQHHRAMRCPGGMASPGDYRRPHPDHLGCSGGYLFDPAGTCHILFTGNSTSQRSQDPGLVHASAGSATFTTSYEEGGQVCVAQYDRLYLLDAAVSVETWELFQRSADGGDDRLQYPAEEVVRLRSAAGSAYTLGDFRLVGGRLSWGARQPQPGEVCSVRYRYRPYWYVQHVPHELRFATVRTQEGLELRAVNQMAYLQREYFFHTEDRDREAPDPRSRRQAPPPEAPQFGPR